MHNNTQRLIRSRRARRTAVAAICLCTAMAGGCRSSMPSWNSFGWKKEPSADALAGVGPTATYPLSPSATTAPAAINSLAASPAGVQPQTSQLAATGTSRQGVTVSQNPESQTPTSSAAAVANGYPGYATPPATAFAAAPAGSPAPVGSPASAGTTAPIARPPAATSTASNGGYVFGQQVPPPAFAAAQPGSTPAYAAIPGATQPNKSTYTAVGYALPGSQGVAAGASGSPATSSLGQPTAPAPAQAAPAVAAQVAPAPATGLPAGLSTPPSMSGGFAMPPSAAVTASPTPASSGGFVMPGIGVAASQPEARTASAPAPSTAVTPVSGYSPGSTSGATSYPTTTAGPAADSGSFYR